jgi:diguanylate cyclase (GGDEF)-like protein
MQLEELFSNRLMALMDVINASGLGLWELTDDKIDMDKKTAETIGHADAEILPFSKITELIHEEDRKEVETAIAILQEIPGRSGKVECRIFNQKEKNYVWVQIMGKSYFNQGKKTVLGTTHIIEGRAMDMLNAAINDITQELTRKDELNQCVHDVTEALLNANDLMFESSFQDSLEIIARSVGLVRINVYKIHLVDGVVCCTETNEWIEDGEPTLGEEYTKDIPLSFWADMEQELNHGKTYNRLVHDIPTAIKDMFHKNVGAVLFSPVFLKDLLWGFVGFERIKAELFSPDEESALSSVGLVLANSLIHNDLNKNLYKAVDRVTTSTMKAEAMEQFAYTDSLTGLFNRRHFMELSQVEMDRAMRADAVCFVMMLDLDFFKKVNDTYGHLAGDEVLKNTAGVIKNTLRNRDLLCRYGGEEFVILISETEKENVLHLAERIREAVIESPSVYNCIKIPCTVSIGVTASFRDCTVEALIDNADKGLYKAKEQGRNRVIFQENS